MSEKVYDPELVVESAPSFIPERIKPSGPLGPTAIGSMYEQFLMDGLTLKELSIEHDVPLRDLTKIANDHNWAARKLDLEMEELRKAESGYRKFLLEHKQDTAESQLSISNLLIKKLEIILKETDLKDSKGDMKLKRIAEALKAAADVGARATGMSDTPISDFVQQQASGPKRMPMVVIGINAVVQK